jgi:hypothetical protein
MAPSQRPECGVPAADLGPSLGRKSAAFVIVEPRFPDPRREEKPAIAMLPMLARARHTMPLGESVARR